MGSDITAADIWPLVLKLPREERVRLARLALGATGLREDRDAAIYGASPPREGEFYSDSDGLSWESEGWEEFDASR